MRDVLQHVSKPMIGYSVSRYPQKAPSVLVCRKGRYSEFPRYSDLIGGLRGAGVKAKRESCFGDGERSLGGELIGIDNRVFRGWHVNGRA